MEITNIPIDQTTGESVKLTAEQQAASRCFAILAMAACTCSRIKSNAETGDFEASGDNLAELVGDLFYRFGGSRQIMSDLKTMAKMIGVDLIVEETNGTVQ